MKVLEVYQFRGEYAFLSNFYVEPDGTHVEGEFQAMKQIPPATECLRLIPSYAKKYGRLLKLRPDWDEVKLGIMQSLVQQKFMDHPALAAKLMETGDAPLTEGNWWGDKFWGVCEGEGENHLGKILMEIRSWLIRRGGHNG